MWKSDSAIDKEVNKKEIKFIKLYEFNNPSIGYNRNPKYKEK
ncbi:hypothetical protein [Clostridium sp. SHJSY1]|nr:hypothetical protein [Clostridium sp. SHJSY1]